MPLPFLLGHNEHLSHDQKTRPYVPLKPGCSIGIPTMGCTLIYIIYMYIKNPITKGSITPRVFLHCSLNWWSAVFQAGRFRRLSRRCCVSCTVKRIPSATPSWWGWPTFPTSSSSTDFSGGGWWFPNVLTLSTGFQEFHVCDLEKILYSYNPNSEWKLDKKGWVWAKRSLMIKYLWAAKNIFKIGRPPTFTLQQAIINKKYHSSQDLWFFYPPQSPQTNNSSCWLSTCVLQGAPPTSYTCIVITAIK